MASMACSVSSTVKPSGHGGMGMRTRGQSDFSIGSSISEEPLQNLQPYQQVIGIQESKPSPDTARCGVRLNARWPAVNLILAYHTVRLKSDL